MIYHLLVPLREYISFFNIFRYITLRTGGSALTALILTLIFIPLYLKKARYKERISEDVPSRHKEKEGTPSAGGIVFLPVVLLSTLLWAKLNNPFIYLASFVVIYLGLMGFIDDIKKLTGDKKKGLSKGEKILLQFILAIVVVISLYYLFPKEVAFKTQFLFFKNIYINFGLFYLFFVILVFIGTTNAVNLTDGLDGLAAGAALAPLTVFILISYFEGNKILSNYLHLLYIPGIEELTIFGGAFLGALLGFLWYNAFPADIFMGDTGSQALGGALGIIAILTKQEFLLAIAGGLFVIEAISVIIQVYYFKKTRGKRIFLKAPLHHHYEEKGFSEPKIVVRMWIISFIFAIIALATIKIR